MSDSSGHCQVQIKVVIAVPSPDSFNFARVGAALRPAELWGLLLASSEMLDVLEVGIVTCDRRGLHLTFWSKKPRKDLQEGCGQ